LHISCNKTATLRKLVTSCYILVYVTHITASDKALILRVNGFRFRIELEIKQTYSELYCADVTYYIFLTV